MRLVLIFLALFIVNQTKAQNTDFSYRELNYPTEKGDPFLKDKADLTKAEVETLLRSGEGKDFTHPELARWATMEVLKSYLDDEDFTPAKEVDGELKPLAIKDINTEEFTLQLVSAPDTLYNVFATLNETTAGYFTRASYEDEKLFVVDVLCMDNRYRRLAVLSKACGNPVRMVVATGPKPESTASTPESEGGTVGGSSASDTTITAPAGSTIHVTQTVTQNNTQSGAQESQTPVEQYQEPNYSSSPSYYDAGYNYPSSYYDYYYPRRGSSSLYAYGGYSSQGGYYGGIGYSSSGSYGYGGGYGYGGSYGYGGGYHGGSYNNCYCGYSHYGKCTTQYYDNHWSSGGDDGDVTVTINNSNTNTNTNNNTVGDSGDTDEPDDDDTDDGGPSDHTSGDTDYDNGTPTNHTDGNIANTGSGGSNTSFKQRPAGDNTSSDKQLRTGQSWDSPRSSERIQMNSNKEEVDRTKTARSGGWDNPTGQVREQSQGEYHPRSDRLERNVRSGRTDERSSDRLQVRGNDELRSRSAGTDQRSRAEIGSRKSDNRTRVQRDQDRNVRSPRSRDDRNVAYNPRSSQNDRSREMTSRNRNNHSREMASNSREQRRTQRAPQRTRFDGRSRLVGQEKRSMNRDRGRVHEPRSRVERNTGPQRGSRTIERSQRDRSQARPSPQRSRVDRGQQNRPAINRTPNRTHERSQVSPPRNRGNVQRSAPNRGAQRNTSPRRGGGRR